MASIPAVAESQAKQTLIIIFIVGLVAIGQLASTIYLPALPALTKYFNVQSTYIQYICGVYILAFACSQFIYGPISDHYGRRITILISLLIFILGCTISVIAHTVNTLLLGSLVQGLGMGCSSSMARTILRDAVSNEGMHKIAGVISASLVVTPLIGPLLGGYIQELFFWQANFMVLLGLGFVSFILVHNCMPETNQQLKVQALTLKNVSGTYVTIISNKIFLGYTLCGLFSISAEVCYEITAPFLLQSRYQLTPSQYGWINILPLIGYLVGTFSVTTIQKKINAVLTMIVGLMFLGAGGCLLLAQHYLLSPTIMGIVIPMFIAMLGLGIIFPSSIAGAMLPFATTAGAAGAAIGGIQNIGASFAGFFIALFTTNNTTPLACFLLGCALFGMVFFLVLVAKEQQEIAKHV